MFAWIFITFYVFLTVLLEMNAFDGAWENIRSIVIQTNSRWWCNYCMMENWKQNRIKKNNKIIQNHFSDFRFYYEKFGFIKIFDIMKLEYCWKSNIRSSIVWAQNLLQNDLQLDFHVRFSRNIRIIDYFKINRLKQLKETDRSIQF